MKLSQKILFWFGITFLAGLLVLSFVGPMLNDPLKQGRVFLPASSEHWLGTDQNGRDVFARLCRGAQSSLMIGVIVEFLALSVGIIMAVLGMYAPRWIGYPLMRLTDAMFAFPDILLAILLVGILQGAQIKAFEGGFIPVIVALSITAWPGVTRLVRGQLASLKDREYVVAAKASGASTTYIVTKHILPQLWGLLLAVAMVELAGVILAESTLSFIGIGVMPPNPSWGNMIDKARQNMNSYPAQLFWPCLVLSLTIFSLNFVGDGLRTITDPKSK